MERLRDRLNALAALVVVAMLGAAGCRAAAGSAAPDAAAGPHDVASSEPASDARADTRASGDTPADADAGGGGIVIPAVSADAFSTAGQRALIRDPRATVSIDYSNWPGPGLDSASIVEAACTSYVNGTCLAYNTDGQVVSAETAKGHLVEKDVAPYQGTTEVGLDVFFDTNTGAFEGAMCFWPGHGTASATQYGQKYYWWLKASDGYTLADAKAKSCPSAGWDPDKVPVTKFTQADVDELLLKTEPARKLWWWKDHPPVQADASP